MWSPRQVKARLNNKIYWTRQESAIPAKLELMQNHPNRCNPSTVIAYSLSRAGKMQLVIYNGLGQKARSLVNTKQPAGYHPAVWDGKNDNGEPVPSGIYLYRIQSGSFWDSKKMLLVR